MKLSLLWGGLVAALVLSTISRERPVHETVTTPVPGAPGAAASTTARATDRFPTAMGDLVVSPLEHASILFGWNGKAIYVDPTLTAIGDERLPKADVVFVTDVHFDHLDPRALVYLARAGTIVVGPRAVAEKVHVDELMDNGDARVVLGIRATAVPMYNIARGPAPGLLYHERGRGNGYVLDFAGTRVYLSGDTECTPEMRALQRIDVAFVCMSLPTTMTPVEAADCVSAFRPKVLFPYHDRGSDLSPLERSLNGRGIDVRERPMYPRPEAERRQALAACAQGHFGLCRDVLDRGQALDPSGEMDPRVVHAREQIRAWYSPFPESW